ncbi:MAG: UbiH/UbiF family hydroxylase [Sideroxydans sp.]
MKFDIVIVGGGIVGAALAAFLRDSGLTLALVEGQPWPPPAPQPSPESEQEGEWGISASVGRDDWDSRIYALTPGNVALLTGCGAWQLVEAGRVQQVEEMRVFGDTGAILQFSAYQLGKPELAFIVESRALQQALWAVLRTQKNVTLIQPARCAELAATEAGAHLVLQDGRQLEADLIVGADGRDSWVRQQAGMPEVPTPYHQHGVVANFTCNRNHRGIAYQWFTPEGILALLPLPGRRVSMVWSVSPQQSAELLALPAAQLATRVAAAAQHILGELTVITPAASFPLRVLNLAHLTLPRLALIGDAAHNIHPLSGHGVNLGLHDAHDLAQVLLQRGALNCGDLRLLRRYERARQPDILSMQLTTDALKHLFVNSNPLLRTLRNIGLTATNALVPLKKMLARHALN